MSSGKGTITRTNRMQFASYIYASVTAAWGRILSFLAASGQTVYDEACERLQTWNDTSGRSV